MATSQRVKDLIEQGDRLFSKRGSFMSLCQTTAEQFYPIRADFTTTRDIGEEFAANLMTGRPVLAHRDLGNALSSMLRPRGTVWAHVRTDDERINEDATARQWLDAKSEILRDIMYHQKSGFVRSTKQGDNDFIAFGQCVIQITPNSDLSRIIYRNWHIRDVVWCENEELVIDTVHRKWKIEARSLVKLFPKTVDPKVKQAAEKEPYREINCRHIVIPADGYDLAPDKRGQRKLPYVSLYIDCDHETVLEEIPQKRLGYVIPRWVTVAGSQYAYSPATVVALPDARLLQQITLTLLESGQKAVDPPWKATREALVGGVNAYAGGITWVDYDYDERLGAALEPLMDTSRFNLNFGKDREDKVEALIAEAFYLNKITLPEVGSADMTAYEVQKRIEEYIRGALPLFEPMEVEYNGALCEETWNLGMDYNAFGPMDDIPDVLAGQDVRWQFESPLQAAKERAKSQSYVDAAQLLKIAVEIDPASRHIFNNDRAFRDALSTVPATWIASEKEAQAAADQERRMMQVQAELQQAIGTVGAGADAAARAGEAGMALQEAGMV